MSCDIREYKSMDLGEGAENLTLTAFVGGACEHSIQFTIGNKYCALSQEALEDLIYVIQSRLLCEKGYTATGYERREILFKEIEDDYDEEDEE